MSFSGFDPIVDHDYHYYDESWNVVSSKQEAQLNKARIEELKRIEKIKNEKMIIKSRNEQRIANFV